MKFLETKKECAFWSWLKNSTVTLKGKCHDHFNFKKTELFKFDSRRYRCKANPPAYDGSLAAKRLLQTKELIPWAKRGQKTWHVTTNDFFFSACAAHDSFSLTVYHYGAIMSLIISPIKCSCKSNTSCKKTIKQNYQTIIAVMI